MTRARAVVLTLTLAMLGAHASLSFAFLPLGLSVNGQLSLLKWRDFPVRYFVTNQTASGIGPDDFQRAVDRAFATWQAVPTASIAYTFGGFTDALPGAEDGISTLGFVNRPDLDRTLASTTFLLDMSSGDIIESDIFFNSVFQWSVAPGGEANHYDLQTIALHEIGHFSGLGHSALGETEIVGGGRNVLAAETVMFPIAFPAGTVFDRVLRADDIAGISALYPDSGFEAETGTISGRVRKNGMGLYGAHLVAFNPSTGVMIGSFALGAQGQFLISGLSPGPYAIRVEPLDDADTDSFVDGILDLDFRVTYFRRLVVAPRGGDSGTIEIAVTSK